MSKPFTSLDYSPSFTAEGDMRLLAKGKTSPLYVFRSVVNTADIVSWAKAQGFASVVDPAELHVTVIYSKSPVDWFKFGENWSGDEKGQLTINAGGPRAVEKLGDKGAVVLMFASSQLSWRNRSAVEDLGASWDYPEYQPHITITYAAGGLDLTEVEPYTGKIVLGPEMFEDIDDNWSDTVVEVSDVHEVSKIQCRIAKVDDSLGIVFGWAIVSSVDGEPYYDLNIDKSGERVPEHIPEQAMLKAAVPFAEGERPANDMHDGPDVGTYPFIMPLTDDIAKAFGIECDKRGLMIGFKPTDKALLKQFADGTRTGFSIEGHRVKVTEHASA